MLRRQQQQQQQRRPLSRREPPPDDDGAAPPPPPLALSSPAPQRGGRPPQGPCLRYPLYALVAFAAILALGTLYSDWNTRDPCAVLSASIRSSPSRVPKLYHHQSGEDVITDEVRTWIDVLSVTRSQTYPDIDPSPAEWTRVYWSDASCSHLVRDSFPSFLATYDRFVHTIQRVDACRYLIMSRYGGVYADSDVSLHSDKIELLIPDGVGLVESPYRYNERVQNSLMTSDSVDHPFWGVVADLMKERGGSAYVLSSTGPRMLSDAAELYGESGGAGVSILPCELFQRLPYGRWDTTATNKLGREVLSRAAPMRGCGRYGDGRCEIARHGGRASWTVTSGVMM